MSPSKIVKEIFFNLLASLFAFYSVYYITASLVHGIFRLDNFDGTIPFHYESYGQMFTNSTRWHDTVFLGDFISLESTYLIMPLALLVFLRSQLWDYAVTTTAVHCLLVCLVNVSFPLTWEWWVCLLLGLLLSIGVGEITNALIRRKGTGAFSAVRQNDDIVT